MVLAQYRLSVASVLSNKKRKKEIKTKFTQDLAFQRFRSSLRESLLDIQGNIITVDSIRKNKMSQKL